MQKDFLSCCCVALYSNYFFMMAEVKVNAQNYARCVHNNNRTECSMTLFHCHYTETPLVVPHVFHQHPRTPMYATLTTKLSSLLNSIQPRTVHSNLIIHLIRLARNPLNMPILRVHLIAHRPAQLIEALSRTVESIYSSIST